jgi:hypothetical protein
MESINVVIDD